MYRFTLDSDFNMMRRIVSGQRKGTSHGDDLLYLFFGVLTSGIEKGSMEYKTIQRFVGMFTQFAKTGNPNIPEIEPTVWEPVRKSDVSIKCLNIGENVYIIDMPDQESLDVWDTFFPRDMLI